MEQLNRHPPPSRVALVWPAPDRETREDEEGIDRDGEGAGSARRCRGPTSPITVSSWGRRSPSIGSSEFGSDNYYDQDEDDKVCNSSKSGGRIHSVSAIEKDTEWLAQPEARRYGTGAPRWRSDTPREGMEHTWLQAVGQLPSPPLSPPTQLQGQSTCFSANSSILRGGSPDITLPRLGSPHIATSSGSRTPRATQSPSPRSSYFFKSAVLHPMRNHSLTDDSEIDEHLADGIAALTVAMSMDQAGRWRIKRRDDERNDVVDKDL